MATTKTARKTDTKLAEKYRNYLRQMLLIAASRKRRVRPTVSARSVASAICTSGRKRVGVGCISQLRPDDYITTTYRDHGQALARGMSPRTVMAELFGKATGCSKGKGGSMHLFDAKLGFLGGHGIVGGHIPLSAGIGFAIKYRQQDQVSICFFGEAAINNGAFHEALNMAGIWKLPCIFICENNRYGMALPLTAPRRPGTSRNGPPPTTCRARWWTARIWAEVMAAMDRAVVRARRRPRRPCWRSAPIASWGIRCQTQFMVTIGPGGGRGPPQA